MYQRLFSSHLLVTRRFSISIETFSQKKLLKSHKKPANPVLKNIPANFLQKLKDWPKLFQDEINAHNEHIKDFLKQSNNDWQELEIRGFAMGKLRFVEQFFHPIDGEVIVFRNRSTNNNVKRNKEFRIGSPVSLCDSNNLKKLADCIYLRSNSKGIALKVLKFHEKELKHKYSANDSVLLPAQDFGTLQSLQENLDVKKLAKAPGKNLIKLAFRDEVMPSVHNDKPRIQISEDLNDSQTKAVAAALNNRRPFICIQGPPGTGKTRVVAEIVKLLSQKKEKVLVCAPSHVAVDNVMNKTIELLQVDLPTALEDIDSEENEESVGVKRLDDAMLDHPKYSDLIDLSQKMTTVEDQTERKKLAEQFSRLKSQILKECYKRRKVVFCTLTSSVIQKLRFVGWSPDVLIIDEAGMCIEPQAWVAILKAKRCILVGDHAQLPPVLKSPEVQKSDLSVSLMERLCKEFPNSNISFLLSTQYRMNKKIMEWSSRYFYESKLVADDSVAEHKLSDIGMITENHRLNYPMIFIDTGDLKSFREEQYRLSYRNFHEASFIASYVNFLLNCGVPAKSIGVITPYFAQVQAIRELVPKEIAVSSVDGFQGQEKDVILFSLVRNNPDKKVGFLKEARRMNVAITRAKRQFCLVGSRHMLQNHKSLRSLLNFMKTDGKIYPLSHIGSELLSEKDVDEAVLEKRVI